MKYGLPIETIETLLKDPRNQTIFEASKEIQAKDLELIAIESGIRIYLVKKSDGTNTITLVFQPGISQDPNTWLMWRITEQQAHFIQTKFPDLYRKIDQLNTQNRKTQ